jgi:hypothetical protein
LLNDQSGIAALLTAVDKRVRFDAAQALTVTEQQQARQNIGAVATLDIGNFDTDFVAASLKPRCWPDRSWPCPNASPN